MDKNEELILNELSTYYNKYLKKELKAANLLIKKYL